MKGTVKWFNNLKNFGFITPDDGSKDVFVHMSGLKEGEKIKEGDKVTFEIKEGDKGPQAVNVIKSAGASEEKKETVEKKEGEIKADEEILKEVKKNLTEDKKDLAKLKKPEKKEAPKKAKKTK